jgi:hypothetical protein
LSIWQSRQRRFLQRTCSVASRPGSSAETRGFSEWTSASTWCATRRTIRLAVGGGHRPAAVFQPARQSVDPVPAVWVEHHLDDGGVLEEGRDPGPSAVRSMCAPREKASEWSGVTATIVPVEGQSRRANGDEDD